MPLDTALATVPQGDPSLDALASRIRDGMRQIEGHMRNALHIGLDVGDTLKESRKQVSEGWQQWLRDNCFLSVRTAQLYMQLAEHRVTIEEAMSLFPEMSLRAARSMVTKGKGRKSFDESNQLTLPPLIDHYRQAPDAERTDCIQAIPVSELLLHMSEEQLTDLRVRVIGHRAGSRVALKVAHEIERIVRAQPKVKTLLADNELDPGAMKVVFEIALAA